VSRAIAAPRSSRPRSRVELRTPSAADRDEFLAAMRTSRAHHSPWMQATTSDEGYERLLARVRNERFEPMLICRRTDGRIVGFININEIVRGQFQSAYLGYGGVAAHAGRGYMTEGLQLVVGRAFTELRLHRLEANIQPANQASRALVQRCGFVYEGLAERYLKIGGRWRDHEHWVIRAEQWKQRRRE
jgi:[ribosomal protein S5]-alanine N-acetyltransferase